MLRFEPYSSRFRNACVALYRSNVPKFFLEEEIPEYERYLDENANGSYWCAFQGEMIVGAGGIWIRPDGIGRLVFGIIRNDLHRKGYGRQLLLFRMKKLAACAEIRTIRLDTSQHNPGFFGRFGFTEISVARDHYGPGLHSHELELNLDSAARRRILELSSGNP